MPLYKKYKIQQVIYLKYDHLHHSKHKQLNRYKKHNKITIHKRQNHYERPFSKLLLDENNISKVGPKKANKNKSQSFDFYLNQRSYFYFHVINVMALSSKDLCIVQRLVTLVLPCSIPLKKRRMGLQKGSAPRFFWTLYLYVLPLCQKDAQ